MLSTPGGDWQGCHCEVPVFAQRLRGRLPAWVGTLGLWCTGARETHRNHNFPEAAEAPIPPNLSLRSYESQSARIESRQKSNAAACPSAYIASQIRAQHAWGVVASSLVERLEASDYHVRLRLPHEVQYVRDPNTLVVHTSLPSTTKRKSRCSNSLPPQSEPLCTRMNSR